MATKKLESTFVNMVLVLFSVCLISAASLGFVYGITREKIETAKKLKQLKAIEEVVLPGYDNMPFEDVVKVKTDDGEEFDAYPTKKGRDVTSIAIKAVSHKGFSGDVLLMVGFLPDGTVNKISVVEQKETPGLGTKMTELKFKKQFYGKNPKRYLMKVKKDGGKIDAITAATISSRAFTDAVTRAHQAFINHSF